MANDEHGYYWFHSIDLGDGRITPGEKSLDILEGEWTELALPPLAGRTVLDIGAWDGWFSFAAERAGASRVVAIDHFAWSLDFSRSPDHWEYTANCRERGQRPVEWGPGGSWWNAETLPGKRGFDVARNVLGSRVEDVVADFMTTDLDRLGTFEVVLYLGVLYHMKEPLTALTRLRKVTGGLAVIESAAILVPGHEVRPLLEFDSDGRINGDTTNWYFPTEAAIHDMLWAAGFSSSETVARSSPDDRRPGIREYRITVHARS